MLIDGFDDGLTMIQLIDIVYDSLSISKYDELRIIYELFSRAFNLEVDDFSNIVFTGEIFGGESTARDEVEVRFRQRVFELRSRR